MNILPSLSAALVILTSTTAAFEPTHVKVKTTEKDETVRQVDLAAARQQVIESYMRGADRRDLELNMSERKFKLCVIGAILLLGAFLSCASYQCHKHMIKDFYKMHAK